MIASTLMSYVHPWCLMIRMRLSSNSPRAPAWRNNSSCNSEHVSDYVLVNAFAHHDRFDQSDISSFWCARSSYDPNNNYSETFLNVVKFYNPKITRIRTTFDPIYIWTWLKINYRPNNPIWIDPKPIRFDRASAIWIDPTNPNPIRLNGLTGRVYTAC